jgi:hypothetical protein
VTLSPRAGLLFLAISLFLNPLARAEQAQRPSAGSVDYAWVDSLERQIEKLLPTLLGSLAAARREREPTIVRCFDRAISALHSVERQVAYHADRLEEPELAKRGRHQKALLLLRGRVEELSQSGVRCFTDGALSQGGQTQVEVSYEAPRGP